MGGRSHDAGARHRRRARGAAAEPVRVSARRAVAAGDRLRSQALGEGHARVNFRRPAGRTTTPAASPRTRPRPAVSAAAQPRPPVRKNAAAARRRRHLPRAAPPPAAAKRAATSPSSAGLPLGWPEAHAEALVSAAAARHGPEAFFEFLSDGGQLGRRVDCRGRGGGR